MIKLIVAAVIVVKNLAWRLTKNVPSPYTTDTTEILYIMVPRTAASTTHICVEIGIQRTLLFGEVMSAFQRRMCKHTQSSNNFVKMSNRQQKSNSSAIPVTKTSPGAKRVVVSSKRIIFVRLQRYLDETF